MSVTRKFFSDHSRILPYLLVISSLAINTGYAAFHTYAEVVLADNPLAYYRFEDSSTNNLDTASNSGSSGSVLDGEYIGSNFSQIDNDFNSGVNSLGSALNVGNNSGINYVKIDDHNDLDFTTALSIEAWVNLPTSPSNTYSRILDKHRQGSYMLYLYESTGQLAVEASGGRIVTSEDIRGDGWTHIVSTYEGGIGWSFYLNGELQTNTTISSSIPSSLNTNTSQLNFFSDPASGGFGDRLTGLVDEIALYDTTLSAERVLAHYSAAAVPEASSYALLLGGLALGLAALRRR